MVQSFVRGDTFAFKFSLMLQDGTPLKKENIDTLYVTCRKHTNKESPILFQKTLKDVEIDEEGYCHAKFNSEDTETLTYGTYYFDIEVTTLNGYRKTKLYQFILNRETTIHESGDDNGV